MNYLMTRKNHWPSHATEVRRRKASELRVIIDLYVERTRKLKGLNSYRNQVNHAYEFKVHIFLEFSKR